MGSIEEYYAINACRRISTGMKKGGYNKLKQTYPNEFRAMEEKLERNFTQDGVNNYVTDMINGLKAIGYWQN